MLEDILPFVASDYCAGRRCGGSSGSRSIRSAKWSSNLSPRMAAASPSSALVDQARLVRIENADGVVEMDQDMRAGRLRADERQVDAALFSAAPAERRQVVALDDLHRRPDAHAASDRGCEIDAGRRDSETGNARQRAAEPQRAEPEADAVQRSGREHEAGAEQRRSSGPAGASTPCAKP